MSDLNVAAGHQAAAEALTKGGDYAAFKAAFQKAATTQSVRVETTPVETPPTETKVEIPAADTSTEESQNTEQQQTSEGTTTEEHDEDHEEEGQQTTSSAGEKVKVRVSKYTEEVRTIRAELERQRQENAANQALLRQFLEAQGKPQATPNGQPAQTPPAPTTTLPVKPKVGDFADYAKFEAALESWQTQMIDIRVKEIAGQVVGQHSAQQSAQQTAQQKIQTFNTKLEALGAEAKAKFQANLPQLGPLNDNDVIMDSPHSAQLALDIINSGRMAELAAMTPVQRIKEIGKIEAAIETKSKAPVTPTVKTSQAAAPVKRISGTAGGGTQSVKPVKDMNFAEYKAAFDSGGRKIKNAHLIK